MDIYNTEGLNDYRSALENVNGVIQLNKDKVEELSKAKAKETLTTLEANDAQAKNQYIRNMEEIEQLRNSDLELTEAQKTRLEFLESQQSLISSNSQQYQIMAVIAFSTSVPISPASGPFWLSSHSWYAPVACLIVSAII